MTTNFIRQKFNVTQKNISDDFDIPLSTIKNWDARCCMPEYVFHLICEVYELREFKKNLAPTNP